MLYRSLCALRPLDIAFACDINHCLNSQTMHVMLQNLLMPHSQCDKRNVAQQYVDTRGLAAIKFDQMRTIQLPQPSKQPCSTMGVHPAFGTLQKLWKEGDAAFFANVGALVEPVTREMVRVHD